MGKLAEKVKEARTELGIGVREFATLLDVSPGYVKTAAIELSACATVIACASDMPEYSGNAMPCRYARMAFGKSLCASRP